MTRLAVLAALTSIPTLAAGEPPRSVPADRTQSAGKCPCLRPASARQSTRRVLSHFSWTATPDVLPPVPATERNHGSDRSPAAARGPPGPPQGRVRPRPEPARGPGDPRPRDLRTRRQCHHPG